MPFGTITSTDSNFGSISGTIAGTVTGTLSGSVGVPGPRGEQGATGATGATGPAGPAGTPGQGVPTGGSTGQYLVKASGTSYDTVWQTLSGYATESWVTAGFAPIAAGQPASGTVGQVLTKNSGASYDSSWQTLIPGDRYLTTSTTSLTVSNGVKTLTVQTGLSYSPQQDIVIAYNGTIHMHAVVTTYDSGTGVLVCDVQNHTGSGTFANWTVNVGGTTPLQSVYWGDILGTLGDQSDLATALNAKLETTDAAATYYLQTNPAGYIDSSALSGYATQSWVDAQGYLQAGALTGYATESWVTAGFYPLSGNPSGFLTSASLSGYAQLSGATFTGEVATPASTTSSAGFSIAPMVAAPTTPQNGEIWNSGTELLARISGVSETLARQSWVTSQGYITSSALTPYAALAGATFTGLVNTPAATTTTAGFRLPHGTAPTTPTDGDVWTTTGNLWVRISGVSQAVALQGSSAQLSTNNIFTNASSTYGNSTAAGTINLGTGATISGATKAINIGTAGVSGSTTNIAIGSAVSGATTTTTINGNITATGTTLTLGNSTAASTINIGTGATLTATTKAVNIGTNGVSGSTTNITIGSATSTTTTTVEGTITANGTTLNLGTSTAAATYNLGTGATLTATTKAVNIGTSGVAGSTTNITIGSTTGTSTTTLQGTTNAVTAAQNTNTTQVATTAFVLGQASSTTPVVDGTAAVGTATTFARADHVHPTDTSRAALASPTFTGTPAAPTAAVDTNTTQIATTAYVVGQGYLKSATASSTYAPLASPALTGTPTAPTATAGTNTTQLATTAFVQSALPVMATETQAIYGTSSTTTISPLLMRYILANPMLTTYNSLVGNYSSFVSGSGAISAVWSNLFGVQITAANGKAAFQPNSQVSYHSIQSRGKAELNVDWTKPMWFSFRFCYSSSGTIGDSNTVNRVTIGKVSSTFGDLSNAGFGVKWTAGTTGAFTVMAHNGTTLTTSASAVTVSNTTYFPTTSSAADFMVYSDGTGNVTLYCNNVQVATTTGGPSSGTSPGPRFVFECDNTTSTSGTVTCDYTGVKSMLAY